MNCLYDNRTKLSIGLDEYACVWIGNKKYVAPEIRAWIYYYSNEELTDKTLSS
jgi:hypothetical protein